MDLPTKLLLPGGAAALEEEDLVSNLDDPDMPDSLAGPSGRPRTPTGNSSFLEHRMSRTELPEALGSRPELSHVRMAAQVWF